MVSLPAAIVFDFDLTLADSVDAFVDAYTYAARQLGLPEPTREAATRMIGTPLPRAVPLLFAGHDFDAAEYIRHWQARAEEIMIEQTYVLEGIGEALHQLSDAGIRLGIVSQKFHHRVALPLEREGLLPLFDAVFGGDDLPDFKPDPRGLLIAIESLGAAPDTAFYCGDTVIDAEMAKRAGVRFVAVLTGHTTADDFIPYAPLATLPSVSNLPGFLDLT